MIVRWVATTIIWFKSLICLRIGKISTVCVYLSSGLWSSCSTQRQRWGETSQTHTLKTLYDVSHVYETLSGWQSWVKPAHRAPLPPHTTLCSDVWHTRWQAPCALQPHTPACVAGGVSCSSDEATFDQWAAVRTVRERGGNSPPIAPLSTWEPALPQGGARPVTRCLNEH